MKSEILERTRFFKFLVKHFGVYRGDPNPQELEALSETQGRVKLVVTARWIVILFLMLYALYMATLFSLGSVAPIFRHETAVMAATLAAVILYNLFLHLFYRELSHLNFLHHLQIIIDIVFTTIVIHFSGGAVSWFWTIYLLVTLEASFLIDRKIIVWEVGAAGSIIYGTLLAAEYLDLLQHVTMPYTNPNLHHQAIYVMLMWFWVAVMNTTIAIIGAFFARVIRRRENELRLMVIRDQMTGLYNRGYFFKMLNSEIQRSLRYGRVFSILVLDIDNFKRYNDSYGHLEGDELLKKVAQVFRSNARRSETPNPYDIDIPCRYGGEEFAIILPETPAIGGDEEHQMTNGLAFAERIRLDVESLDFSGHRTTISIGLASFPEDGDTPDALVKAADDALYQAKKKGKNRVIVAQQHL